MRRRVDIAGFSAMAGQRLTGRAAQPLRLFVLGATGRTGQPFVAQALARGHRVTALVRGESRLPAGIRTNQNLQLLVGDIGDTEAIVSSWGKRSPDAVVTMLSSETPPYNAVSTGTRSVLEALCGWETSTAPRSAYPTPLISIASWGLGPTEPYIKGLLARVLVHTAKRTFWAKPFRDFEKQLADIAAAAAEGLIRPAIILPPILTNGARTGTYLSGDAHAMKDVMSVASVIARASIADLALKLSEKAVSGENTPAWIAIRQPRWSKPRGVPAV